MSDATDATDTSDATDLEWGTLVIVLRALKGWSQEDLAVRAEVSASAIQRQERGIAPKPWVRESVEKALGITGISHLLQHYLGGFRTLVNNQGELPSNAEEAGTDLARLLTGALRAALAEMQKLGSESGEETPRAEPRDFGLNELRKELLERRLRRERRMGLVPYQ